MGTLLAAIIALLVGCTEPAVDETSNPVTDPAVETRPASTPAADSDKPSADTPDAADVRDEPTGDAPVADAPSSPPSAAPTSADDAVQLFPGVRVHSERGIVELEAVVVLDVGWLEQIACAPGTREHETLLVPRARASEVHAALLAAGCTAGRPGTWREENGEFVFEAPQGTPVEVRVRYADESGKTIEVPVTQWIRDHHGRRVFPDTHWVFAGSRFETLPDTLGAGEVYVADETGSIIGLVTFGDEVLGLDRVIADETDVAPAEWEAHAERMPDVGTVVTIVLQKTS